LTDKTCGFWNSEVFSTFIFSNQIRAEDFCMKLKNFVLAFIFLSVAAVVNASAQFDVTGSITGRVLSANGNGIRRANVTVINLTTLETEMRTTNDFGYFRFNNLPIIDLYLVTVSSKRHFFTFSNQLVQFTEIEHQMTFTSDD